MAYALVTPPAVEPVSLAEAKAHLHVEIDEDDALIEALIVAVRQQVENATGRSLITQTWRSDFRDFPRCRGPLRLMHGPVQSVTTLAYYDPQGADTTLSGSLWKVDLTEQIPKIWPVPDEDWPCAQRQADAVRVTYEAGYGDAAEDVPQAIRQAMLLLIGLSYDGCDEAAHGSPAMPFAVTALLSPYVVRSIA